MKGFVEELTIKPISTGFEEYETQINAIQTIMSNTRDKMTADGYSEAERLEIVNDRLDQLNHYADKTIYNFTEMTRNIGTFTAAGVELDTAVSSIQGIANLAAVSGSTSEQASRGMYQLSQAISTGSVKLMDWNSVVNAGMGGELFQKALRRTAKAMGVVGEEAQETFAKLEAGQISFRDSLSSGWLTSEVLTNTLEQFSWDFEQMAKDAGYTAANMDAGIAWAMEKTKQELLAQNYSEEEADEIIQLAKDATEAATKVKTFTQLFDTLKEAAQSGWTQTWEYIIGDFEEAKELLTSISDFFGGIIEASAEARNKIVSGWKDLGGRDELIQGFWNIVHTIQNIVNVIRGEFEKFFPPTTSEQLFNITKKFREFTDRLKAVTENSEAMAKLGRIAKGLAAAFDMVKSAVGWVLDGIGKLVGSTAPMGTALLDAAAKVGDFFVNLHGSISSSEKLKAILTKIGEAASTVKTAFSGALSKMGSSFKAFGQKIKSIDILSKVGNAFTSFIAKIPPAIEKVKALGKAFGEYETLSEFLQKVFTTIKWVFASSVNKFYELAKKFGNAVHTFFSLDTSNLKKMWENLKTSFNTGLAGLSTWVSGAKTSLQSVWAKVKDIFFHFFTETMPNFFEGLAGTVATAVAAIGKINWWRLATAFLIFAAGLSVLSNIESRNIDSIGTALLKIAGSIAILVAAMVILSKTNMSDLGKSLKQIVRLVLSMALLARLAGKSDGGDAFLKMALAVAVMMLPLKLLSNMDTDAMLKGVLGLAAVMAEIVLVSNLVGNKKAKGLISMALAVNLMALAMKSIGKMSLGSIGKGLLGIGGMVAAFVALSKSVGGMGFGKAVVMLLTIAGTLTVFVAAFNLIDGMNVSSMLGFAGSMAGMLLSLSIAMKLLSNIPITGALMTVANLAIAIAGIGAIIVGLGALSDAWEGMTGFLESGANVLGLIGNAIGQFVGGIAGGFVEGLNLPSIGTELSGFMTNVQGFLDGAKNVDESVKTGVGNLNAVITKIAGAEFTSAMAGLFTGENPVTRFAGDLKTLGTALSAYGLSILPLATLPAGLLDKSVSVANALADVAAKIPPTGGIVGFFSGVGDMAVFSGNLTTLGGALTSFATSISEIDNEKFDQEKIDAVIAVATGLSTLETNLEGQGGFEDAIEGVKSLSKFSEGFEPFREGINAFITEISQINDISKEDKEKLDCVIGIGVSLSTLEKNLEGQGGLEDAIEGVKSLSKFSKGFKPFGTGLNSFIDQVRLITYDPNGDDAVKMAAVIAIAESLSALENGLEGQGGWEDGLVGIKSLAVFGSEFPDFATALNSFIETVSTLDDEKYDETKISNALQIAQSISDFEGKLPKTDGWWQSIVGNQDLSLFSTNVKKLGRALASFANNITGVDVGDVDNAVAAMNKLQGFINGLDKDGGLLQDIGKFVGGSKEAALISLTETMLTAGENLKGFADSVTGLDSGVSIDTAEQAFSQMQAFIDGIEKAGGIGDSIAAFFGGSEYENLTTMTEVMADFGASILTISEAGKSAGQARIDFTSITALLDEFRSYNDTLKESGKFTKASQLNGIGNALKSFGEPLVNFMNRIDGINVSDLQGAVNAIDTLIGVAFKAQQVDLSKIGNLADILEEYGMVEFDTVATNLGNAFGQMLGVALQSGQQFITSAGVNLSGAGVSGATSTYNKWLNAGRNLASGLANGITMMSGKVRTAAMNVAAVGTKGVMTSWDEHSPSKVGEKLGGYFDLGIAEGIGGYASRVRTEAAGMSESAIAAAKTMLLGVNDSIFDHINPNPTIRPVLDLSNVQSGVNAIGGMFGNDLSIRTGMFRGISATHNAGMLNFDGARILGSQNNTEIVNELHSLSDRFDNLSRSVSNMQVVLDTGTLVGQTAAKMDRQLGLQASRRSRGN